MSDSKSLTIKILLAIALGLLFGIFLKNLIPILSVSAGSFISEYVVKGFLVIGGNLFINLMKLLIVPLVLFSIISGVLSVENLSELRSIGGRALIYYILTTFIALCFAISFALFFQPGVGVSFNGEINQTIDLSQSISFVDTISALVPSNIFSALANADMLQIIIFALILGIAVSQMKNETGERLKQFFLDCNELAGKLTAIIMSLMPYGVFCLISKFVFLFEVELLTSVLKYNLVLLFTLFFHWIVFYSLFLFLMTGLNPIFFFKKLKSLMIVGFSTSSSSATIPVSLVTSKNLGVDHKVSSFVIPLGATINMDGTAIMQGVATVFIAQIFQIDLTLFDLLTVVLTATLASIGTAGIPAVGLITLAMVLQQVGIPIEGIALVIGFDRLLDMIRTVVNITGDIMVSVVVAKQNKLLDVKRYSASE